MLVLLPLLLLLVVVEADDDVAVGSVTRLSLDAVRPFNDVVVTGVGDD